MNCKPGDLAIIVAAASQKQHIGKIVKCLSVYDGDAWNTDPELKGVSGRCCAWYDAHLRPIRDTPGEDETLQWAPVPGERVTA